MTKFGYTRYQVQDKYISDEMSFFFRQSKTDQEKIDLLKTFLDEQQWLPYEVASIVAKDPSPRVRHWFAKNAPTLDYSSTLRNAYEKTPEDADLLSVFSRDPEPLVLAAAYENPNLLKLSIGDKATRIFQQATAVQRLALMRNPNVTMELVHSVLDLDDKSLALSDDERESLIFALLTNTKFLVKPKLNSEHFVGGSEGAWNVRREFEGLCKLALKWKRNAWVQVGIAGCMNLSTDDKIKIYEQCDNEYARQRLVATCEKRDKELLDLALKDKEEYCRETAQKVLDRFSKPILEYWERDFSDGWIGYGLERSLNVLHPTTVLLNDDNFSTDEKLNQLRRLSFFIFERLRSAEQLDVLKVQTDRSFATKIFRGIPVVAGVIIILKAFSLW